MGKLNRRKTRWAAFIKKEREKYGLVCSKCRRLPEYWYMYTLENGVRLVFSRCKWHVNLSGPKSWKRENITPAEYVAIQVHLQ